MFFINIYDRRESTNEVLCMLHIYACGILTENNFNNISRDLKISLQTYTSHIPLLSTGLFSEIEGKELN